MVWASAGPSDPNTITDPNSVGDPNQTSEPNEPVDSNEPGIDSAYFHWSQPPVEIDPNLEEEPTLCGWHETARSTEQSGETRQWRMDADDFHCLGAMPVTRIRWWGGYKAWKKIELPESQPELWHITFWANQVEGVSREDHYPERPVWPYWRFLPSG